MQKHGKQPMRSRAFGWKEILSNDFVGVRHRSFTLYWSGEILIFVIWGVVGGDDACASSGYCGRLSGRLDIQEADLVSPCSI
jgi:hypothetical protein